MYEIQDITKILILWLLTALFAILLSRRVKKLKRRWKFVDLISANDEAVRDSLSKEIFFLLNKMSVKELNIIHIYLCRYFKIFFVNVSYLHSLFELNSSQIENEDKRNFIESLIISNIAFLSLEKLVEIYSTSFNDKYDELSEYSPNQKEKAIILSTLYDHYEVEQFLPQICSNIDKFIDNNAENNYIKDILIAEKSKMRLIFSKMDERKTINSSIITKKGPTK